MSDNFHAQWSWMIRMIRMISMLICRRLGKQGLRAEPSVKWSLFWGNFEKKARVWYSLQNDFNWILGLIFYRICFAGSFVSTLRLQLGIRDVIYKKGYIRKLNQGEFINYGTIFLQTDLQWIYLFWSLDMKNLDFLRSPSPPSPWRSRPRAALERTYKYCVA